MEFEHNGKESPKENGTLKVCREKEAQANMLEDTIVLSAQSPQCPEGFVAEWLHRPAVQKTAPQPAR